MGGKAQNPVFFCTIRTKHSKIPTAHFPGRWSWEQRKGRKPDSPPKMLTLRAQVSSWRGAQAVGGFFVARPKRRATGSAGPNPKPISNPSHRRVPAPCPKASPSPDAKPTTSLTIALHLIWNLARPLPPDTIRDATVRKEGCCHATRGLVFVRRHGNVNVTRCPRIAARVIRKAFS